MLALTLLLSTAQAAQPTAQPAALSDFRQVCIETEAAGPKVAQAAARLGWTSGPRTGALQLWSKAGDGGAMTLISGLQGGRLACAVQVPAATPGLAAALPGGLGPQAAVVDASKGLYLIAKSAEAVRRGQAAFVSVESGADKTSLTYIRSPR